jgi:hypothetical protein
VQAAEARGQDEDLDALEPRRRVGAVDVVRLDYGTFERKLSVALAVLGLLRLRQGRKSCTHLETFTGRDRMVTETVCCRSR